MTTAHTADGALSPELEAIATAAHDRLHAQTGQDLSTIEEAERRVAEAASAAIAAGARLSAIADAERAGEQRARQELSADVLRQVTRAAKKKRDADTEYEQAITRAGRLGLSHREIAECRRGLARHHPRDPHPHHDDQAQRTRSRAAIA